MMSRHNMSTGYGVWCKPSRGFVGHLYW